MLFFWVSIAFIAQLMYRVRKENKKVLRACHATFIHCDMTSKLMDMDKDPLTRKKDWDEILPLAIESDRLWQETHPGMKTSSNELWVKYFSGELERT